MSCRFRRLLFACIILGVSALWAGLAASSSVADDDDKHRHNVLPKQIECPSPTTREPLESVLWNASRKVYIAGLAADASELKPELLTQLLELNCKYNVGVHILTRGESSRERAFDNYNKAKTRCFGENTVCANFEIDLDPPGTKYYRNRIDRIAYLRDFQREKIRSKFLSRRRHPGGSTIPGAVILADMDIYKLPTNKMIMSQTMLVLDREDHHVICSAGLMHHPFGYDDIFATILEPHTFPYPIAGRLIEAYMPNENITRIRSDDLFSEISQADTLQYFRDEGSKSDVGTALVNSCFGGLAIYRASTWLVEACNYSINPTPLQMRYSNIEDKRPCEHIIFHECLKRNVPSARIFVQPEMASWWDEPVALGSHLFSGGIIRHGIVNKDGLVISDDDVDPGLQLGNGDFILQIDAATGSIVIIEETAGKSSEVVWRQQPKDGMLKSNWKYLFLTLEKDGELTLSQQTKEESPDKKRYQPHVSRGASKPCRTILWTNGKKSANPTLSWVLHLGKDGVLRVLDIWNEVILWESSAGSLALDGSFVRELKEELMPENQSCIPSGNQDDINKALSGRYSEAKLCQASTFELFNPIVFTSSNQRIYTEGYPIDHGKRARLVISDPSVVTAVQMINIDHASLSHVVIDGNRASLGSARGKLYGEALIRAGGESRGQIIRENVLHDTRSWTTVHLAEGPLSERCIGASIEHNIIGSAGTRIRGGWASGIALACTSSRIRNNTIYDVTNAGIIILGAPGSKIEENDVVSSQITMNAGITLVDFDPYGGNYTDVVVANNTIDASGAAIGVAIAMGVRTFDCMDEPDVKKYSLYGAKIVENTIRGMHLQYGYAVDGVRDWQVTDNEDKGRHNGKPNGSCYGKPTPSAPAGFQITWNTSVGDFQAEFESAYLEMAVRMAYEDSISGNCLKSGDQDSIGDVLTGIYADAALCPGAIFELTGPVVFNAAHQRIYTQGYPEDGDRAILRIVDPSLSTAVLMYSFDRLELRNVIIDGNRKNLGLSSASSYGDPLIKAGGESRGQIIRSIHAFDPRGWAVLHFAEGDPTKRCSGALIESNLFGPAGGSTEESLASGLALACMASIARHNVVVDTSATGIGVFGCPGSIVEENTIVADSHFISGGINLVDYDPFEGNFNQTVVRRNTVHAKHSPVIVGFAMGFRNWHCMDDGEIHERTIWGANVTENILEGEYMRYGFAINGVRDFTVIGNLDRATHVGISSKRCPGRSAPSAPSGFQVDRSSSSGNFQSEFEDAILDIILRI